jgi:anti-sigma B factor antagonist
MTLGLESHVSGDTVILRCYGRIVFGDEGAAFRERVKHMLIGTPKVVVDLTNVDYIDSTGLGILVELLTSARGKGGEIKLVSPSERVQQVLYHTKLNTAFRIYKSDKDAVAAFGNKIA